MKKAIAIALAASVLSACAAEKVKVACVGDSITYGYTLPEREKNAYPTRLQELLDEMAPGKYEVRNFGNSGRGIYLDSMRGREKRGFRFMKEHKAAIEWKPDIVVCNLGINDCGEYIKEYTGKRRRGQFKEDYLALLGDYKKANPKAGFVIWTKLSPLAEGQKFYRSPEPFLMQADLKEVAKKAGAKCLDMQHPLRENMDSIFKRDKIHPDPEGAEIIAKATLPKICGDEPPELRLPSGLKGRKPEIWLCAGQSNMQKGWDEFRSSPEEKKRVEKEFALLDKAEVWLWDVNDGPEGQWTRLTAKNAGKRSAFGVSFAIRRALKSGRPVAMLYVAAGGAPTESFLAEETMCKVGKDGKPVYPKLCAIATNRHQINANNDFPCAWCKREYQRRKGKAAEAGWWPVSLLYDRGIALAEKLPLTGILWYQGESNATRCVAPEAPLDDDYMLETNLAVVDQLRGDRKIPFIMMGLPKMNRPWEPYRAAQKKACEEKGAIFVDTFAAGLGTPNDVHPRDKIPFAELAIKALEGSAK
ncbi:MAG: hypothetical protein K6F50_05595 [Kiritimatiellae bacterium]|nr:hypothetical protein [Kiritimatiellia bacterium]